MMMTIDSILARLQSKFRGIDIRKQRSARGNRGQIDQLEARTLLSAIVFGAEGGLPVPADTTNAINTDVSISKTSDTTTLMQGGEARYTVTVKNEGTENASNVLIKDPLKSFLTDVRWSAAPVGGATAPLTGTGDLNESVDLPAGSSVVFTIAGTVKQNVRGIITNVATVSLTTGVDANPSNNRSSTHQVVDLYSEPNGIELVSGKQILGPESGIDAELGDFDGDGDLDAIFVNGPRDKDDLDTESFAEIWFNVGAGQFIKQYEIPANGSDVALGDLNGDGHVDLFFVNAHETIPDHMPIWLNDGTGHFNQAIQKFRNLNFSDVQLADVNGDGVLDAIVIGRRSDQNGIRNEIRVWLNDGNARFQPQSHMLLGYNPSLEADISLGDIDGDGDLDAFVADDLDVYTLRNDGTGHFSIIRSFIPPEFEYSDIVAIELKDVNGDGKMDAVIVGEQTWSESYYTPITIAVYLGNGTGDFTHFHQFQTYGDFADVGVEDFNGDGYQDIAIFSADTATIFTGNGRGQYKVRYRSVGTFSGSYSGASYKNSAIGDVDNDGDLDIVGPYGPVQFNGAPVDTYFDNFNVEPLKNFTFSHPESASAATWGGSQRLRLNAINPAGMHTALFKADYALPSVFEMSAQVTAIPGANQWQDGFLVFDYVNKSNFKYAGMLAGQNQWVIGHYQGDFSNRAAQIDWDDHGRSIKPNRTYLLNIHVEQEEVYLSVDGEFILKASFNRSLTDGKVGFAAYRGVTLFDNFQIDSNLPSGTFYDFPYHEDFNDNVPDQIVLNHPHRWDIVDNGPNNKSLAFNGTNYSGVGTAVLESPFNKFVDNDFSVVMTPLAKEGNETGGYLIFGYRDADEFDYVRISVDSNEIAFGSYYNGYFRDEYYGSTTLDRYGIQLQAGTAYELQLTFDDRYVSLWIDGIRIFSDYFDPARVPENNIVGVGAYQSVTLFDDFRVGENLIDLSVDFPFHVDFEDGSTGPFDLKSEEVMAVIDHENGKVLRINQKQNRYSFSPSTAIVSPQLPDDRVYQLSVDVRSNALTDGWNDGFLIFDYKSNFDFKYAGFFAGQNKWVIGHYRGDWGYRLAEVDWSEEGRRIEIGKWYSMAVTFNDSQVTLSVDGEQITSADFGDAVHTGGVGFGVDKAFSWFDNFRIGLPTTAPHGSDPIFAQWNEESDELLI